MQYTFEPFVLDAARRELRRAGDVVDVQPLVFELLLYLICHRDRVVPKAELLDSLWADAAVTEASLARAVSLARRAIDDDVRDASFIRTHARVGYRFTAAVEETVAPPARPTAKPASQAPTRSAFTRAGGTHIAYQIVGDGPVDVVVLNGWVLSIGSIFEDEALAGFFDRLAEHARLIFFDKRGTGLSDRVKDLPGLAQRMEDLTAVLDAVGSKRAHVLGVSEGAPMSLLYAASHPDRVSGLALIGGFARMTRDDDQPFGWSTGDVDRLVAYIRTRWGEGRSISTSLASRDGEVEMHAWAARAELIGGSPGAALELWNMNRSIDVRDVLPLLDTPCLVLHSKDDPVIDVAHGRQLADRIAGARMIEIDGVDHLPFFGEAAGKVSEALKAWIEGPVARPTARRRLATLLVTEFAGEPIGEAGDRPDRRSDDRGNDAGEGDLEHAIEQVLVAHRGRRVDVAGAPWAALFDGPALAARCALAIQSAAARRGVELRGALHCSEVECVESIPGSPGIGSVAGFDLSVSGPAVDETVRLLGGAALGETWTTPSVTELVVGSGIEFVERTPRADGLPARAFAIARADSSR